VLTDRTVAEVVGANGKRMLFADMAEGVWIGAVLIASRDDLNELAMVLKRFAVRRP
jgi:hypothetical protein